MKKLILILLLVLAAVAFGQLRRMYTWTGNLTSSWTAIAKSSHAKITLIEVSNDGTADTDTVWVAFNADTTSGYIFPLYRYNGAGENKEWPPVYLDTLRLKSNGTVPARVNYY